MSYLAVPLHVLTRLTLSSDSYHWQRLLVRAPVVNDPLLGLSSLPLMVRSASQLIRGYSALFDSQRYIWPVLARVAGSGNVVVQSFARGELPRNEAEELLALVLSLLKKLELRLPAATTSHANFCALATALGEPFSFYARDKPS